jgi:hypothetical protein
MDFSFIEDETVRTKAEADHKAELSASLETVKTEMQADFTTKMESGVKTAVDEAVKGLKDKNSELLGEKKKFQEKMKSFEGINDPEAALEALQFIEKNEHARLLKEGKIDEVIGNSTKKLTDTYEKKMADLEAKFEAQVADIESGGKSEIQRLQEELTKAQESATTFQSKYQVKTVEDSLRDAALAKGVRPEAVADVLLRGNAVFSLGDDGAVEARDADGNLLKSGTKLMTPDLWVDDLKKSAPYFWPGSKGTGADGGAGGGGGASGDLTEQIAKAAANNDMVTYRKLLAKKNG